MTDWDDTIAAVASAPGAGWRSIVRVAGPATRAVVSRCFEADDLAGWTDSRTPRRFTGRVVLPGWRTPVDASALLWPGSRSYTGTPAAELHLPGSPPLVEALLSCLFAAGARPARAGEFTLRAFLAGRIDLPQAEAVLGVIDAEDHQQLRAALEQLAGGISGHIAALREQLLLHLADLEAGLDFADEDIEFVQRPALQARLAEAGRWIDDLGLQAECRLQSTGRRQVVLAGLPNAGKSTLFNALAGRDEALVSPLRGTTRDVLSADVDWDGVAVTLWDTAGWEALVTPLDHAANAVRDDRLARAELIVWCTALDATGEELVESRRLSERLAPASPVLPVRTKADLAETSTRHGELSVSAADGTGLAALRSAGADRLSAGPMHHSELLNTTAARCRSALQRASAALSQARQAAAAGAGDELLALHLREALAALGEVCGEVYTDDILDRIFSRFCIGK